MMLILTMRITMQLSIVCGGADVDLLFSRAADGGLLVIMVM